MEGTFTEALELLRECANIQLTQEQAEIRVSEFRDFGSKEEPFKVVVKCQDGVIVWVQIENTLKQRIWVSPFTFLGPGSYERAEKEGNKERLLMIAEHRKSFG